MNKLLKMVLMAIKNPEQKHYLAFNAFEILNNNRDFDWCHEDNKCDWLKKYITISFENNIPYRQAKKSIKQSFKTHINEICFYPEFYHKANQIINKYKQNTQQPQSILTAR